MFCQGDYLNDEIAQKIKVQLDSMQRENGFPGATFAAILPDGSQIAIATGLADSLELIPMSTENRMLSGSNGKTFFAASALAMESKGLFDLDDPIVKYIGEELWFDRIPNGTAITMRMLMNHTSGLEEYYPLGDFMQRLKENPSRTWDPVEVLSYIFDRKPAFSAGEKWGYADTNYILLAFILEKISGEELYQFIDEQILVPHGLARTEPSLKQSFEKLAVGYSGPQSPFPFHGPMIKKNKLVLNPQFEWAGGGFVSNVKDLSEWMKIFYQTKAISDENHLEMRKGVPAGTGKDHLYGLGVQIRPSENFGTSYGHSGWFPGYITDAAYFPQTDMSVSIQFNTDDFRFLQMSSYNYLLHLLEVIMSEYKN